jgi:hypothetical protein
VVLLYVMLPFVSLFPHILHNAHCSVEQPTGSPNVGLQGHMIKCQQFLHLLPDSRYYVMVRVEYL